jgi:hypothetical protein
MGEHDAREREGDGAEEGKGAEPIAVEGLMDQIGRA